MNGSDEQVRHWGETLAEGLRSLPLSAHGVVLVALLGGIVLWLFGSRSIRMGFTLIGVVGGAVLGAFVPAAFGLALDPMLGAAVGAIAGLILGLTLFRVVTALSMGLVMAIIAPLVASVVMQFTGPPAVATRDFDDETTHSERFYPEDMPDVEDFDRTLDGAERLSPFLNEDAQNSIATLRTGSEKLRDFFRRLGEQIKPIWDDLPQAQRVTLVAASLLGLLVGALIGALLPKKAAALITALAGAALILPTSIWLLSAAGAGIERTLPEKPLAWLAIWAALAVIGTIIQWRMGSARRADNR